MHAASDFLRCCLCRKRLMCLRFLRLRLHNRILRQTLLSISKAGSKSKTSVSQALVKEEDAADEVDGNANWA